jgi:hypothetical protein
LWTVEKRHPNTIMILPKNSKDIEGMRSFVSGIKVQFCSLQSVYDGEIRKLIDAVVASAESVLSKLPAADVKSDWNADDVLQSLCCCLSSTNAILTQASLELNKLKQGLASAVSTEIEKQITEGALVRKDEVVAKVDAAVTAKTASGELVPKDTVAQLCSNAKVNGEQAGRAALQAELGQKAAADTMAAERKTALTTAGKALPPAQVEAILRASQEEFAAAEKKFDARMQTFTAAGFSLTPELAARCWLGDEQFAVFEAAVKDIPALKGTGTQPEPFTGKPDPTQPAVKLPIFA